MADKKGPREQQAEGTLDKMKGKAQEAWGAVTGDTGDRVKGQGNQLKGEAKQQVGKARQNVRDNV
jgi:uncharacterized protein YjbJ (UPF0337 family)